jgi:hypothetical protein
MLLRLFFSYRSMLKVETKMLWNGTNIRITDLQYFEHKVYFYSYFRKISKNRFFL